jgi:hypothetical protein
MPSLSLLGFSGDRVSQTKDKGEHDEAGNDSHASPKSVCLSNIPWRIMFNGNPQTLLPLMMHNSVISQYKTILGALHLQNVQHPSNSPLDQI